MQGSLASKYLQWAYWRFRWFLWDTREKIAARLVLKYLARHDLLYVHDRTGHMKAVVVPMKVYEKFDYHSWNHTHIEA